MRRLGKAKLREVKKLTSKRNGLIKQKLKEQKRISAYKLHEAVLMRKKTRENRREEIIAMRQAGHKLREIGDLYGISHQRVNQICKAKT